MATVNDILFMSESELSQRKNSITKQDLMNALIEMKKRESNESFESAFENFSENFEKKINAQFNVLLGKISQIGETQSLLEESLRDLQEEVKILKSKDNEQLDNVYEELEQRIRRKGNVIISGVTEQTDGPVEERRKFDNEQVNSILKEIDADDCTFEKCHRIGQPKSNGVRLLRVIGFDEDERNKILRKAKSLRDKDSFRGIYVNPDLTPTQQREAKKMRDELKERRKNGEEVVIYRGKITLKSEIKNFQ